MAKEFQRCGIRPVDEYPGYRTNHVRETGGDKDSSLGKDQSVIIWIDVREIWFIKLNSPREICKDIVNLLLKSEPGFFKELNIKVLANIFEVNRSYLSRTFKIYQGENLNEYIKRVRIVRCALILIEKRNLRVSEIAGYSGFNSTNYFIKAFKKFYGITPGKFKKFFGGIIVP